ncbi:MAG: FAD-binding oxidoreductase [Aliidiomarina sp.]|uniref:D-2-hydroxyglutarate dehydrogenase YdiJ n=1 Tax=Aliidiomarina sp. TaxID=1872439 RepID=UPI0025C57AAE|nr:FAD-binding and (Fe-S)-binding domain-containing protein [Aliidiomarina sp.]MCH8500294.1 FAD-binding oxidoreductase [Aliidiomarina sp.]
MSAVIPSLDLTLKLPEDTRAFLVELRKAGFIGDIDASESARIVASTDNSIYQLVPQAILYPKGTQDVRCILRTANSERFQPIRFTARGGGTGTNGQSLTDGVVIDLSRHMNRVLEINLQEGWVRVEAGVVKDQLNQALANHGYFFAPDTSTSNRCTVGGMIATDASGQGSLVYGKTSDHVLGLKSVLASGEVITTQPISVADAQRESEKGGTLGKIYQQVLATCVGLRAEIEQRFPPLNRFLTGYDLRHTYQPASAIIDISRLIAGAEGTLALVTEAKLNITPTPQYKVLVNIKYLDFQDALRHAPELVKAQATSVETVDSNVLDLARKDVIWHDVSDLLTDVPPYRMDGINILEFTATDQSELGDKIKALITQLKGLDPHKSGVIGYQICREADSIQRIYAMRKKAVGLLGATVGRAKPVAFVEDTAVPPDRLADYILEFRALLDSYGLHYGMFGHVDAGVLHVRPALDMQDPASESLVREISDQVVALTAKYGGLMWGEHGKGFRSEYGPEFFGEQLFTELRRIKTVFDPRNRFNPGKICTPLGSERKGDKLVSVDSRKRGWYDRQIPAVSQELLSGAMDCNGNGLCFNFDSSAPMCPSYRASKEKRFSPKGRASLLREWARRAGQVGFILRPTIQEPSIWQNQRLPKATGQDFSDQVRESLDTCLACKACSTQCPVKVDIPRQRAVFYGHYHERYRRPMRDYLIRSSETSIARLARFPRIANLLTQNPVARGLQKALFAYVDTPKFSVPRLENRLPKAVLTFAQFRQQAETLIDADIAERYVFILQDTFTSSFNAGVVAAFARVALALNIVPVLLPLQANGKPAHVKGFLQTFRRQASLAAETLSDLSRQYPTAIVGMDAATALIYRDEYRHEEIPGSDDFEVLTIDEWLQNVLHDRQHELSKSRQEEGVAATLLPHCTEQTALPQVRQRWQQIYQSFGVSLSSPAVGCCGMAGTFGHESEQQGLSEEIYQLSWLPALANSQGPVVASGFSCRCQVERHSGVKPPHPIEWLSEQLEV